jgi:hypothetical protein
MTKQPFQIERIVCTPKYPDHHTDNPGGSAMHLSTQKG